MLRNAGYSVLTVSHSRNRYVRLADVVYTLVGNLRHIDLLVLSTYGGRSFIIEDTASLLAKRFGVPIVMTLHGGAMPEFMSRFPNWTKRVLSRASLLVVQSDYLANAVGRHGFAAHVIPNILDLSAYPYRWRSAVSPRLLWMRAFHSIYHPEMALRVLAVVKRTLGDARLVMAGQDKGLEKKVRRLATELGLADAVRFPGFLDMAGKVREGQAADIFINTPRVDNRPVAVEEAGSMGLAVVSTSVGGIPHFLKHEETGLLVADGDVQAMADAIVRLVEDKSLAGRLSRNGRALAAASAVENVLPQWTEVIDEVALGNGRVSA
ncbi:MAG: glycosyltransferase family 4 protein [Thermoanaerobaculia bacterium]